MCTYMDMCPLNASRMCEEDARVQPEPTGVRFKLNQYGPSVFSFRHNTRYEGTAAAWCPSQGELKRYGRHMTHSCGSNQEQLLRAAKTAPSAEGVTVTGCTTNKV